MHVSVQQLGNSSGESPAPYFIGPEQWLRATCYVVSSGDTRLAAPLDREVVI